MAFCDDLLVARDVGDLREIGGALEEQHIGHLVGRREQRDVAVGGEDRVVELADAVVGIDLHQLRLLVVLRVGMLALELLAASSMAVL